MFYNYMDYDFGKIEAISNYIYQYIIDYLYKFINNNKDWTISFIFLVN